MEELKRFCEIQEGESVYFGPPEGDAEGGQVNTDEADLDGRRSRASSRSSRRSTRTGKGGSQKGSWKGAPPRGKDLLERLMEKGLLPLSALDVIRGWMVLEMSTSTEEERRVIKAARGGKPPREGGLPGRAGARRPGRRLLPGRHDGGGDVPADWWGPPAQWNYYGEAGQAGDWQATWAEEEEVPEKTEADDEVLAALHEDKREYENHRQEIEAMLAENDHLMEARRAVAAAARDGGWGSVQQRQPKPTLTYMTKGKSKAQPKGKKGGKMVPNRPRRARKDPQHSMGKRLPPGGRPGVLHDRFRDHTASTLAASEGLVDTGATATAGGQSAVERLCAAVAQARPDTQVTVFESDRPYFRHGSGKWGRALCRVSLQAGGVDFSMFALPSEGVPVLVGMKELRKMNAFLGCASGRCLVAGRMVELCRTPKGHLVLDLVKHVLLDPGNPAKSRETPQAGQQSSRTSSPKSPR